MEQRINAIGWRCPKPIIETKKILDSMEEGTVITIVDNKDTVENLTIFAGNEGYKASFTQEKDFFHVRIEKGKEQKSHEEADQDNLVIMITTDQFGQGTQELSEGLMKSYIYALTEVKPYPKTLIFINKGVYFTTEGSAVEESLRVLEKAGVEILSCGACLNYYGLTEKLIVGSISNMYSIVEELNHASNSIKI